MTTPQSAIDNWVPAPTATKSEAVYFQESERKWVAKKWAIIRHAQQEADKAVKKWRRVNAQVIDYLDRSGIDDLLQRTRIKSENLTLTDALNTCDWWRGEAQAHIDDLTLYLKLKEMGLL